MAGLLLLVFLMGSCHEIHGQARPPPKVTVNPPMITDTDSVTLSCQTPSSVSVSQCHFYILNRVAFKSSSCLWTLKRTELLKISHQSSPADIQVRCIYTVTLENVNSPFSDKSSIIIHSQKPEKDASCDYSLESEHNSLSPRSNRRSLTDIVARESNMMGTKSTLTMTTAGSTVTMPSVSTSNTAVNPTSATLWLVVPLVGFGVVVILLVLVFHRRPKRSTDRSSYKTKANITDDSVCLRNIDHGGVLPAGNNGVYTLITSVPGADCSTGFEKQNRQEPQREDSDIYHVYSTIPEQPAASNPQEMLYSLLQTH